MFILSMILQTFYFIYITATKLTINVKHMKYNTLIIDETTIKHYNLQKYISDT